MSVQKVTSTPKLLSSQLLRAITLFVRVRPSPILPSQPKYGNRVAATMSMADTTFQDLSVVNPGFTIYPIRWTELHLRVVNCTFNQVTDNVFLQAPKDKAQTESAEKLATRYAPSLKSVYVADLLIRRGTSTLLSFVQEHPAFYFARSLFHRVSECDVYCIDKEKFNAVNDNPAIGLPEPTFSYHRYDINNVRRKRHTAPRAP